MPTEGITAIVSSLGVVGALVWYLYHNTTTTIPNLTKQYTDSQEKVATKFADTQDKIAENFANTLQEERNYRKQEITALQQWIKSEASCKYNRDQNDMNRDHA
jgi:predicted PurR-regulated permease PerM